jgi:soluble epoxide hydrolase/lipid-phosphate phosphatase
MHLAPIGAAEAWISSNKNAPPPSWLTADEVATHKRILAQKGYTAPLNWYDRFQKRHFTPFTFKN